MKRLEDMTEFELRELMQAMGRQIVAVAAAMGCEKPLFALVLFNDPKLGQYVANCRREDIVLAMRETADCLENMEDATR